MKQTKKKPVPNILEKVQKHCFSYRKSRFPSPSSAFPLYQYKTGNSEYTPYALSTALPKALSRLIPSLASDESPNTLANETESIHTYSAKLHLLR